jgi:RNA polymerase sigma factor (sigma-70 family)
MDPSPRLVTESGDADSFAERLAPVMTRLRRVLVAQYGGEVGVEVAADAQAWAWAHQDRVDEATNPGGLLYRVAQSRTRSHHRWRDRRAPIEMVPDHTVAETRPELVDLYRCLGRLNEKQRLAVVMVHAHGEPYDAVADLLGVSTAAVTNHVHRGLKKLRSMMEDDDR